MAGATSLSLAGVTFANWGATGERVAVIGGAAAETVTGSVLADEVVGGAGDDLLRGNGGVDTLTGDGGNDRLEGGAGNDALDGGAGADTILGGQGSDTITGWQGRDVMTGGIGIDVFVFGDIDHSPAGATRDVITDFTAGLDRIDLSALGPGLTFIGTTAFSGVAGQVRFGTSASTLFIDLTGDRTADMAIQLNDVAAVGAADLIL
jgi:Ca2+-binding RTX toxin-like protein